MNSFGYRPWREAIALKSRIGDTDQPIGYRPWREAIALKSRIWDTDQPIPYKSKISSKLPLPSTPVCKNVPILAAEKAKWTTGSSLPDLKYAQQP
jgi:hypothetical protein